MYDSKEPHQEGLTKKSKKTKAVTCGNKTRGSDSVKGATGTSSQRGCWLFVSYRGRFRWWSMIWTVQVYVTMVTDRLSNLPSWLLGWSSRAIHISSVCSLQGPSNSLQLEFTGRRAGTKESALQREINLIQWWLMGRGWGWVRLKPIYNLEPTVYQTDIYECALKLFLPFLSLFIWVIILLA